MPLVNWCKKCKAEVPTGESCVYCGGKLTQTGEQISFGVVRRPCEDWFEWNGYLRILLPVFILSLVLIYLAEGFTAGWKAAQSLLDQGMIEKALLLFGIALLLIFLLLKVQGVQRVHVVLDKDGVHIRTYLPQGSTAAMYAHMTTSIGVEKLAQSELRPSLEGLMMVRRTTLPWSRIRRVRFWKEENVILLFSPTFWQVASIRIPVGEMEGAENYIRKKLKRMPKTVIQPKEKKKKR